MNDFWVKKIHLLVKSLNVVQSRPLFLEYITCRCVKGLMNNLITL